MASKTVYERTVKPRRVGYTHYPLAVIGSDMVITEGGEAFPLDDLPQLIATLPRSIIVCRQFNRILHWLDDQLDDNPRWQFRVSPVQRELWSPNRKQIVGVTTSTVCSYFGLQRRHGKDDNHYHFPLDPGTFMRGAIDELVPGRDPLHKKLMQWGQDVRQFLADNDIAIKPTAGGISGALLRDKRFYPEPRRKIPRATNARARPQLPGNFYRLYGAEVGGRYDAYYLDQSSAHHRAAAAIRLPDANTLVARGYFRPDENDNLPDRCWLRMGTPAFKKTLAQHGLFYVKLYVPPNLDHVYAPPCMEHRLQRKQNTRAVFLYSNELEYVRQCGGDIRYIIAAWTSPDVETGLNSYGQWSMRQLDEADALRKRWLKVTLLSAYGILAATPRQMEFAFKRALGGERKMYPIGNGLVEVVAKTLKGEHEVPIANVIHRGMIEAETRQQSLQMAQTLHRAGMRVLAVYADSVFVEADRPLPLIAKPWRLQAELTALEFLDASSFTSRQMTKLPGRHGEARDKVRRRQRVRQPAAA